MPRPSGPRVAVLSDSLWRRRFAADPHLIGKGILVNGQPYTVVGPLPPDFQFVKPLWGRGIEAQFRVEGKAEKANAHFQVISPDYFRAMEGESLPSQFSRSRR